jgi:hypothetical protein
MRGTPRVRNQPALGEYEQPNIQVHRSGTAPGEHSRTSGCLPDVRTETSSGVIGARTPS